MVMGNSEPGQNRLELDLTATVSNRSSQQNLPRKSPKRASGRPRPRGQGLTVAKAARPACPIGCIMVVQTLPTKPAGLHKLLHCVEAPNRADNPRGAPLRGRTDDAQSDSTVIAPAVNVSEKTSAGRRLDPSRLVTAHTVWSVLALREQFLRLFSLPFLARSRLQGALIAMWSWLVAAFASSPVTPSGATRG